MFGFVYGEDITLYSPDNSYRITLQDKDLWAEWIWEIGDYYQYGNNEPRDETDEEVKNRWANYDSDTHKYAWWWQDENVAIFYDGFLGYDTWNHIPLNEEKRQWPCLKGYHIPWAWEWNELVKIRCERRGWWCTVEESLDRRIYTITDYEAWQSFINEMHLNSGWFLYNKNTIFNNAWDLSDSGIFGYYRSSSYRESTSSPIYTAIWFENWKIKPFNYNYIYSSTPWVNKNYWMNIRCFKNQYMFTLSISWVEDKNIRFSYEERPSSDKINKIIHEIETEIGLSDWQHIEWYTIDGSDKIPFELKSENIPGDNNLTIYWEIKTNTYTIKFVDEEWNELMKDLLVEYSNITTWQIENYTWIKEWYTFKWWKDNNGNLYADWEEITNNLSLIDGDIIYFVTQWEQTKKNWWYSGGWGGSHAANFHWSANNKTWVSPQIIEKNDKSDLDNVTDRWDNTNEWNNNEVKITEDDYNKYWKDLIDSYSWAYEKGLTKYINIEDARLNDWLNRQEMAKISSIFAIEFLGKDPNESKQNFCSKYLDMWKVDNEMKFFIVQSCKLWYMWYESNWIDTLRNFRPYTKLTLAEASTILSRIVRWNKYMMNWKWRFLKHLYAVYEKWLIDDIEDPYAIITRWDVYKMLYRLSLLND